MKKESVRTKPNQLLKNFVEHLQDPSKWSTPKTKSDPKKKQLSTDDNLAEAISFYKLATHIKQETRNQIKCPAIFFSISVLALTWVVTIALADNGVFHLSPGVITLSYCFSIAALVISVALFSISYFYPTDNKSTYKSTRDLKATQENMRNFFKERGLNPEDYKDKPVLKTIRENPIASV